MKLSAMKMFVLSQGMIPHINLLRDNGALPDPEGVAFVYDTESLTFKKGENTGTFTGRIHTGKGDPIHFILEFSLAKMDETWRFVGKAHLNLTEADRTFRFDWGEVTP